MNENLAKIDDFINDLKKIKEKDGIEYVLCTTKAYTTHAAYAMKSKPHIQFNHAFTPGFVHENKRTDIGKLPQVRGIMLMKEEDLSPEVLDLIKDTVTCKIEKCSVYTKNEDGICNVCKGIEE
jgi:hypothetical protein